MVKDDGGVEFHALLRPSSLVRFQLKVHGCPLLSEPPSRPTRGTLRVHGGQRDFSRPAHTVHRQEDLPPPDARQRGETFDCLRTFPPQQQKHCSID